jgi:hypothetical protein
VAGKAVVVGGAERGGLFQSLTKRKVTGWLGRVFTPYDCTRWVSRAVELEGKGNRRWSHGRIAGWMKGLDGGATGLNWAGWHSPELL